MKARTWRQSSVDLAKWRAALDQAITKQEQVVEGSAAMASPFTGLKGAADILPALVDTIERYKMPSALSARFDFRSGDGFDDSDLSIFRAPERNIVIAWPELSGLTCTHIFGFHDFRALEIGGETWAGVPVDEYYSRRAGRLRTWARISS